MISENKKTNPIVAKAIIVAGFIILILIIISVAKETYKKIQIQREISDLQAQAEKITRDNSQIQDKISYLGSNNYMEKEARDKLNLQSPGENVVVISQNAAANTADKITDQVTQPQNAPEGPIYKKWWDYFFKY